MSISSDTPRVVLLTGNQQRHRYAARRLSEGLNLVGIVAERKGAAVADEHSLMPEEQDVIARHFAERDQVERRLLGENDRFPEVDLLEIGHGEVNAPAIFDWVQVHDPDAVLLYGSGIIRDPLLSAYDGRIINLHLGLSPYFKGSGTNFWPLVERLPECVGATIHIASARVDAGAILHQVRPPVEVGDRAHELGTKTLIAALQAMPAVVARHVSGVSRPQPQPAGAGRVFRVRDFNADAVRKLWANLEEGMITAYLDDLAVRQSAYPIVEMAD